LYDKAAAKMNKIKGIKGKMLAKPTEDMEDFGPILRT